LEQNSEIFGEEQNFHMLCGKGVAQVPEEDSESAFVREMEGLVWSFAGEYGMLFEVWVRVEVGVELPVRACEEAGVE
jgi:hypothetical protein